MEPKFVTREEFIIVGMECVGGGPKEFGELWGAFLPRIGEIQNRSHACGCYGLCACGPECEPEEGICKCEETGVFSYTAGVEVSNAEGIPDGMVAKTVPASNYAVFTHKGSLDKLMNTYNYIFDTWLKNSGYQLGSSNTFELYDDRFDPVGEDSELDIYVSIK